MTIKTAYKPNVRKSGASEHEVKTGVMKRLAGWESIGVVKWFDRLNSGTIYTGNSWVRMCKAGTPDVVAYVACRGVIHTVFIECKRQKGGVWSTDQKRFADTFKCYSNVRYVLCSDSKQVDAVIEDVSGHSAGKFKEMEGVKI